MPDEPTKVAIQAPIITSDIVELAAPGSRVFRKEVLRCGTINYKGRRLDFTPEYLDGLVGAFKDQAFDAVHLVFTDAANSHTQDVERIRGETIGLERDGQKLYALVRASNDKAAQLLRENPRIGVSVRIEQPLERADGKKFPAAIQHVLATANPRMTGMGPWESVDLAADGVRVVDLSPYDFADGETAATETDTQEVEMADQPSPVFSPEQTAFIEELLKKHQAAQPAAEAKPAEDEYTMPTDAELDELAARLTADFDTVEDAQTEQEPVGAALSVEDGQSVELAARLDAQAIELAQMRQERDNERYARLTDSLAKDHGIPPEIIAMAKPLLHGTHPVELANGSNVDAADVMRKVMVALSDHTRLVDLARPTAYDSAAEDKARKDAEDASQWGASYAREHGLV